jgi:hypothetical protein
MSQAQNMQVTGNHPDRVLWTVVPLCPT